MKKSSVCTNNTYGNIDYTPCMPTDRLNTTVSSNVAKAVSISSGIVIANPSVGAVSMVGGLGRAMVLDKLEGKTSFSYSITGHDGDTFGHTDF